MTPNPAIRGMVETSINVSDMRRARHFYESIFGFEVMEHSDRFCAFRVGPNVLLLFTQGASDQPISVAGGVIPPHNTVGAAHFALAVSAEELDTWRTVLSERAIKVESEVVWARGGRSIYFRDPD